MHRSCPICEASCGLRVEVDRAARRVLRIGGDPQDPRSRGYLCPKAWAIQGVFEDPDRVRRPLRRRSGSWHEVSWEDAFDEVADRLRGVQRAHGAHAVGSYIGNPVGHDVGTQLYLGHLMGALGSPRSFSAITMDQFPQVVAARLMFGRGMLPVPDLDRTELLVMLGANPVVSQGSIMSAPDMRRRLRELRARGGKLVVVDPRRSETAEVADRHIFIRPGSDAYLLFAMVHVLFAEDLVDLGRLGEFSEGVEVLHELAGPFSPDAVADATGVPPEATRWLARELAGAERACCYGRIGTCTQEFGTLASWLIYSLGVLTGHLDAPGGPMFPRQATGQLEPVDREAPPMPYGRFRTAVRGLPEVNGTLPSAALAEEIDAAGEDRIRALVTIAGNPVLSTANGDRLARALERLDFMLSLDIYLNETTRHADFILPSTVHLEVENYDYLFQGTSIRHMVRWSGQVFEPEPGARDQWEILLELGARLSGTTAEELEERAFDRLLTRHVGPGAPRCRDVTPEDARAKLGERPGPMRIVDLMLRAGPFGDGFDDAAEGLSLARLRAADRALDLGPLEPRLPDILRTPGRRIQLAPIYLVKDVERLRGVLAARSDAKGLRLVGRRQLRNMNSWLHNVSALASGRERCTLMIHPADAEALGIANGVAVRVRSRVGEVCAQAQITDEMMPGAVSLPHGFGHTAPGTRLSVASQRQPGANANALTDELGLDVASGTSIANGIPVEVESA